MAEAPLWMKPLEIEVEELGITLVCRYPSPEEKAEAKKLAARTLEDLEEAPNPEESERRFSAWCQRYDADAAPTMLRLIGECTEAVRNGDGSEVDDDAQAALFAGAHLWDHSAHIFQELFFRGGPSGKATAGSRRSRPRSKGGKRGDQGRG